MFRHPATARRAADFRRGGGDIGAAVSASLTPATRASRIDVV
jgi:hypothetical protein